MKRFLLFCCLFVVGSILAQSKNNVATYSSRTISFDKDWLFKKENAPNSQGIDLNDRTWRKLDLPHDWGIEDLPNPVPDSIVGPFSRRAVSGRDGGYTVGGTAWYRKHFVLNKASTGKKVFIQFDGVYMNADVWINGHHLGNHPHGYTTFYYELTPYLNQQGQSNVIAVQVKNEGHNSRWYSGSGIYRHVWLTTVNPLHIDIWGTYITTPSVTPKAALVSIETTIQKASNKVPIMVQTEIYSPTGALVGKAEQPVASSPDISTGVKQAISVSNPSLWSLESPTLYRAKVKIVQIGKVVDETTTQFGIRAIHLDAKTGFTLNGKNIKLKGGCIHHDNGPLGAVAIDRAEERKIVLLKQQGYNAIRSSHYPPSSALIHACDSLGMLVIDEAFDMWEVAKTPQDCHLYFKDWWQRDIQSMLLRDRNHPSVIMWSIGNEIPEVGDSSGYAIGKQLAAEVRRIDATRPITQAIHPYLPLKKGKTWDEAVAPSFAKMDVAGYNYNFGKYEDNHEKFPDRIMMATESYPSKALENWNLVEKHPYVIGDFVWTAMDYLGEAAIGHTKLDSKKQFRMNLGWPWFNAYCGDLDLIGNKKPQSYFRDVLWRNRPIAMAVHAPIADGMVENVSYWGWPEEQQSWTWPEAEGKPLQVRVFSRAPMVRLYLNGKVIGEQTIADSVITAVFQVPYQPGTLKAVNVESGKERDVVTFTTAGVAKNLRLKPDESTIQNNRNDLSYVMVEVVDDKGQVVPNAEVPIQFAVSGGEIAGVGSGNPTDVASFQRPERKTWRGKCLVIVRPNGKGEMITLKATADSLTPAQVKIKTR